MRVYTCVYYIYLQYKGTVRHTYELISLAEGCLYLQVLSLSNLDVRRAVSEKAGDGNFPSCPQSVLSASKLSRLRFLIRQPIPSIKQRCHDS